MELDLPLFHSFSNFVKDKLYTDFTKVWVDTLRAVSLPNMVLVL